MQQIAVPAYFDVGWMPAKLNPVTHKPYPYTYWDILADKAPGLAKTPKGVVAYVVADEYFTDKRDDTLKAAQDAFVNCNNNGQTILGYIDTNIQANGERRSEELVKNLVDKWYALYPQVAGIFFDDGPSVAHPDQQYYKELHDYVKAKFGTGGRGAMVMLNMSNYALTNTPHPPDTDWLIDKSVTPYKPTVADIYIVWEGVADLYVGQRASYNPINWLDPANSPAVLSRRSIAHTVLGVQNILQLQSVISAGCQRGAGYGYVLDKNMASYGSLPGLPCSNKKLPCYEEEPSNPRPWEWNDEVQAVQQTCPPIDDALKPGYRV